MEKKTGGVIATVVAVLLCGCPGLFAACFGAISAGVSFMPDADIDFFGSSDPKTALTYGIGTLCFGLIFILIPIVVGFFTLRKKPGSQPSAGVDVDLGSEPFSIPPESAATRPISEDKLPPPN